MSSESARPPSPRLRECVPRRHGDAIEAAFGRNGETPRRARTSGWQSPALSYWGAPAARYVEGEGDSSVSGAESGRAFADAANAEPSQNSVAFRRRVAVPGQIGPERRHVAAGRIGQRWRQAVWLGRRSRREGQPYHQAVRLGRRGRCASRKQAHQNGGSSVARLVKAKMSRTYSPVASPAGRPESRRVGRGAPTLAVRGLAEPCLNPVARSRREIGRRLDPDGREGGRCGWARLGCGRCGDGTAGATRRSKRDCLTRAGFPLNASVRRRRRTMRRSASSLPGRPSRLPEHRLVSRDAEARLRASVGQSLEDWLRLRFGRVGPSSTASLFLRPRTRSGRCWTGPSRSARSQFPSAARRASSAI